ncbi:MAG TPA: hypothetical protein VJ385_07925 [Fibrobacteria bacterium]|nr:hypothetical protein [Fibrobacteria bacterium]
MMDLSPIANAVKSVQAPPPQAQPSVVEEMKPVPQTETVDAVPPLPAKGGEPGLGEHLDLYDTEVPYPSAAPKETKPKVAAPDPEDVSHRNAPPAELSPNGTKAEAPKREKPRVKTELLGDKTDLPPPPPHTVDAEFPFLKPLGGIPLGKSIDARI